MSLQLKISLDNTKPPVWRRILVPDNLTFMDLHEIIVDAMGWSGTHMFAFSHPKNVLEEIGIPYDEDFGDTRDAAKIRLKSELTAENQKMKYVYDFGDDWQHTVLLEKIYKEKVLHPVCLKGKGACPPEDCGGIWGYYDLVGQVTDPSHPEYRETREWLGLKEGETWDVTAFDLEDCNARLQS